MSTWCIAAVVAVCLLSFPTVVVEGRRSTLEGGRWLPLEYFVGHWFIRDFDATALSMFLSPPSEVSLKKMGVYDGALIGSWLLRNARNNASIAAKEARNAAERAAQIAEDEEAEGAPKIPPHAVIQDTESDLSIADNDVVVPVRVECDSTLFGGTVTLGENVESVDDDSDKKPSHQVEHHWNFFYSYSGFHHYRVAAGECPKLPAPASVAGSSTSSANNDSTMKVLHELANIISSSAVAKPTVKKAEQQQAEDANKEGTAEEEVEAEEPWRWCKYYQLTILDVNAFTVVLTFDDGSSRTLLVKRNTLDEKQWSWETMVGTVAMLIIVAGMKFGPKLYFKAKGVDVNMYKKHKNVAERLAAMTPEQRAEVLRKQKELMAQIHAEEVKEQQRTEERRLAKEANKEKKEE